MDTERIGFSLYRYDYEGDIWDDSLFLHIDGLSIPFESVEKLMEFANRILRMEDEIMENIENDGKQRKY